VGRSRPPVVTEPPEDAPSEETLALQRVSDMLAALVEGV
jgi:hypothetical protein